MADLYNHYKGVEPDSISKAASDLKEKVLEARSKLSTFKASLSDSVWKASAKETLFKAIETLDTEVYKEIIEKIGNAETIASNISKYNSAKSKAEGYLESLQSSTKDTPQSSIDGWRDSLTDEEDIMRECVGNINSLL